MPLSTRYGFADAPTSAIKGDSSLGWTTLASTIAAGAASGTFSVVSSAGFPSALQFDIDLGLRDATTGLWSSMDTLHITVVSGTTWTFTRTDTTFAHAIGDSVSHVTTALGLMHNPGARTDAGDFQYLNASGRMARLAAPSDGDYALRWTSAVPSYVAVSSGLTFPDLATPPTGTALGASGTPFGSAYLSGSLVQHGVFQADGSPLWSLAPTFPAEPAGYTIYTLTSNTFTRTASGATHADLFPAHTIEGTLVGGDYLSDGDGLVLLNIASTVSGGASVAYNSGIELATQLLGAGSVATILRGLLSQVFVEVGASATTATGWEENTVIRGTATTAVGVQINTTVSGTVTNLTGLSIANVAGGTNTWAIKTGTGAVSFGDAVTTSSSVTATDFVLSGGGTLATQTYVGSQGFVTASSATAFSNKSGNISQWTNDSGYTTPGAVVTYVASLNYTTLAAVAGVGYATATSSTAFTNKSGNISQWTNDSAYTTLAAVAGVGYATASSSTAFTNKTGAISQWTNDASYTTLAAVAGVGYLTSVTTHNVLSTTHGDALADTVVRGDLLYGNSTPKWARLAKPSVLSGLSHDGTDVSWVTATGTGAPVRATSPTFTTPILGVASSTSLATSAASPFLLTNGQLITIALTSQTVNPATLTIPNFASVSDTFAFLTLAQTVTNKRITKRVVTASDATSITPNSDNADVTYQLNTQALGTLTINADGGTPTHGQAWLLKIKSTTIQTFAWNGLFVGGTIALPTATSGTSKIDYFSFVYDTVNTKWHFTGSAAGF